MGKNFKLLLSFLLCLLGIVGVRAQSNVAQWNGTDYETLQAAFDAAEAADPKTIEITLLADAELDVNARSNILSIGTSNTESIVINGADKQLTIHMKNTDWSDFSTANDYTEGAYPTKVTFNNVDVAITWPGGNNAWNNHALGFSCPVEFNNVTFDRSIVLKKDATLNNVTVNEAGGFYGIIVTAEGQTVDFDNVTINATNGGRGIKVIDQYIDNREKVTLSISNSTFNTASKAAVLVTSTAGADITASGNNIENVAKDKTNLVWIDANRADYANLVNVTGATAIVEGTIAKIGNNFYKTIADAVAAATEGQTVEVFAAGTYTLPGISKNITIEGTVDGVVFDHTGSGSIASIPNGATFKNVAFNFGNNNYHGFQHAGTINMEDCTLNGKLFSYSDMNFTNCEFNQTNSDYHMWTYSGNVTYTGCTFTNSATGKFLNVYHEGGKPTYTVTVTDCKFVNQASAANKAALNVKATSGSNLLAFDVIINNCTTEGAFPEANWGDKLVVLNSVAQVDDRTDSGVDNITVTQDGVLIYPRYAIQVTDNEGNETKYLDMKAAFDAINANPKESYTITLLEDANYTDAEQYRHAALTEDNTVTKTVVIDGNGHNLTFVGGGVRGFYTESTVAEKVTFQNMTIVDNTRYDAQNGNNAWEFAYLEMGEKESCALEFTNVKFADGISVDGTKTTFTNCEFIADGNAKRSTQTAENCLWISNGEVTVSNCTFTGYRAIKLHEAYGTEISSVVIDGCTITDLSVKPAVAIGTLNAATSVTITNCTIEGVQKGDQSLYLYESDTNLANFTNNFSGNTFNVKDAAELSAALSTGAFNTAKLLNDIALTADITCGLEEGTFTLIQGDKALNAGDFNIALNPGVTIVTDKQTDVFTAVDEEMYTVTETVLTEGDYKYQYTVTPLPSVAKIGEQGYPTLQKAINVAYTMTGDVTIELLKDIEGYSIVHQKAGLNLTIDGKEFTLNGQIIIDGDGRSTGTETLTIQNFKFEGDGTNFCSGTSSFIEIPSTKITGRPYYTNKYNYAHNITISDCSFTSTTDGLTIAAIRATSGAGAYNVVVSECTGTNLHSLAQLAGTTGGSFTNNTVTSSDSFVNLDGGAGEFTISGNNFTSIVEDGYGIREKGNSTDVITLTDNTFIVENGNAVVLGKNDTPSGTINIVSGIYVGDIANKAKAEATGKIVISGGHFSAPLGNSAYAQFIAEGLSGVNGIYATETPEAPNGIGEAVASVTEGTVVTNYASLESAIAAANDGATVTLLTNCTGNGIKVPQGKFTTGLTVDFANFTYTVDGSTVGSTGTETNGFQLLKDNKITFKNGTITSEKAKILVQNYSDLTLEGMTLTLNNAGYSSAYTLSNNNGNIVIDGSTINANPAGGFAFDVCRYSSYPSVNVTVKGESVINGDIEVYASGSDAKDGLGLTLEAGTFNGAIVLDATAKAILNATPEKAVITKDNTLTSVAAPADFKWVDNGDGTSTLAPREYVAQIGDVKYETLAEAVAAVQDGETILMIADVPNAGGISVPSGKNFTVDFDGHTYTLNKPGAGSTGTETSGFQLLMNSNITFKNGTINISEDNLTPAVAPAKNIMRIIQNYANLTLDNMTIDGTNQYGGKDYVLSFNNGTSVIKESKVIAGDDVIAFDVCRYSSYPSVNVTVKGESVINGDIEVYASGNDPKDGMYLTVEGGTINGKLRLTEEGATAITETSDKAAVKKNNDVDLDAPADFKWRDNNDGTSTLVPCEYICAIGTTKYETLAEAVAAAGTNAATITLLTEAATDGVISGNGVVVPKGSNITFDLNGLTYNVSGETVGSSTTETQGFQLLKESNITFKNGTLKATATTAQMIIQNYCNLTLTDVTLDGRGLSGWAYALSNNCGTINLTGSTSIIAKEGGRAFDTCKFGSYAIPTVNINTTGTISGPIEATGGKLNIENGKFDVTWNTDSHYAAGDIQITGGIYTAEVPEEYCAEGYVCTDNEDEATKATYPYTVMENELAGVFDLVDWEPYPYTGETKKTPRISYTRDTTHDGKVIDNPNTFRSWYVPFDYTIKAEDLESAEFFKIHLIAASAEEGGEVTDNTQVFIHIERLNAGDKMKGNRPYVVRYKEAGTYKYEEENTTIYKADAESSRLYMATSEWDYNFYGTYDSFQATKPLEWMSLSKSTGSIMMNATAAAKLQQYRWYIRVTANTINDDYSNIRFGFVVDGEEGEATSIFAVEGEAQVSDEISGIYSVNGTKYGTTMDDLQKGVNIVRYKNGTTKKVLVK